MHVVALADYKRQNIMQAVFRATYSVKQVHTTLHYIRNFKDHYGEAVKNNVWI